MIAMWDTSQSKFPLDEGEMHPFVSGKGRFSLPLLKEDCLNIFRNFPLTFPEYALIFVVLVFLTESFTFVYIKFCKFVPI